MLESTEIKTITKFIAWLTVTEKYKMIFSISTQIDFIITILIRKILGSSMYAKEAIVS